MKKADSVDDVDKFSFTLLENTKFKGFADNDTQDFLFKWGMQDHCYIKRFTFDQPFQPYQIDGFLVDFFNQNPHIKVLSSTDRWGTLGRVTEVSKQTTSHTITSLNFFDRLKGTIVRPNGQIIKCLDEYFGNFLIGDELRKCLLMNDFQHFNLFTQTDREEFIFHIFKAICLGGRLCQYEDDLEPYLSITKKLYKDLICVAKDKSGVLKVSSYVYKVTGVESSVSPLFPLDHPQNFCYVTIDANRRHLNLLYHASEAYY
ncbi:hypothetical protein BC833DRAFT_532110 [Globomyces pollinis-pini]|nr:hypothetical protein BC833DRAFT_532110 [Globomyces pollinis-pini]